MKKTTITGVMTLIIALMAAIVICNLIDDIGDDISSKSSENVNSMSYEESQKAAMIHQQCVAFATSNSYEYIDVDSIDQTILQAYLNGYEYYTSIKISINYIMNYLKSELDENGYSVKTYEDNGTISDYVYWAYPPNDRHAYVSSLIKLWGEYREKKGIDEHYSFYKLTPEDINQLSEKFKNPDYQITIELPKE